MFSEQAIERINCQIACTVYDKYETDIYGLYLCPIDYNKRKIKEQFLLKDLLDYCSNENCSFCNIEFIKSLI